MLRIGTRGSPLALRQTEMVEAKLAAAFPHLKCERVVIRTSGDWKPEQGEARLSEAAGGKGLFAKEIEAALLDGAIDCAVHSLKDMPSFLPDGLALDHMLERADPRDVFVSHIASSLEDLPVGATLGTAALRRQAFALAKRPDLKIVPLRGNVQTRLAKLAEGQVDATYLALAGLSRLGIAGDHLHIVPVSDMLPACGQGIVGIEMRSGDTKTKEFLDAIHHAETGLCGFAERAALQVLDGSCHTPIGAYARMEENEMTFDLCVAAPDGGVIHAQSGRAAVATRGAVETFAADIARALKAAMPSSLLA